jgi:RHS repeat-associated protein
MPQARAQREAKSWLVLLVLTAMLVPGGGMLPAFADPADSPTRGGSELASGIEGTLTRQPLTTPTALGDGSLTALQYADPTESLAIVSPPDATSQGNATLSHPILIPPGRGGVQPDLTLHYDSSNGDGWLGVGWNLAPGEVSIDTRWGAPRYLPNQESETYMLNGDVLSPNAVRSTFQARVSEREDWTRRVETQHDRIIRHGTNPKDYWWEVVDKNGAHFWYGGFPDGGGPNGDGLGGRDDSAILRDDNGNAYRWALSAQRDVGVNGVRYYYETVQGARVGADGVTFGKQLYLKRIQYTVTSPASGCDANVVPPCATSNPPDPAYEVRLLRDGDITPQPVPRRDVIVDAHGGVVQVTSDLLRRIEVWYGEPNGGADRNFNILARRYNLNYVEGAFGKSLLKSIDQVGSDGAVFATNTFDYYDEVRDASGNYHGFDAPRPWNTQTDNLHEDLIGAVPISALGGSLSNGGGFRIYIGFNPGDDPLKDGSFGGDLALKGGDSEASAEFLDINGDGLPDKVFRSGGGVSYRLNTSGPSGSTTFDPQKHDVVNLSDLSKESNFEAEGGPAAFFGASIQFGIGVAVAQGEAYFVDVNNDGLPDFVSGGTVYFNHLEPNAQGVPIPTFESVSTHTRVPIDAGVAAQPSLQAVQDLEAQEKAKSPLVDTVRRWTAPWTGHVAISGDVTFSPAVPSGQTYNSDGVRAAIEAGGTALWSDTLTAPGDVRTPTGVANLAVSRGDAVFFRLGSIDDGVMDRATWNPAVAYLDVAGPADVNGLSQTTFQASSDFTLAGRPHTFVVMPLDGTVRFTADVAKTAVTSDDVTVLVLKNGVPVIQQTIPAGAVTTAHVTGDFVVTGATPGPADRLEARLSADSPVDVTKVGWTPTLYYLNATSNGQPVPTSDSSGNNTLTLVVPTDTDIYPSDDLGGPQQAWSSNLDRTVDVDADVEVNPLDHAHPAADVVLTVKGSDGSLAKQAFTVAQDAASATTTLSVAVNSSTSYWFDLSVRNPDLSDKITSETLQLKYNDGTDHTVDVPHALHWAGRQGVFPIAWRGWAYAGYNADGAKETAPIDPSAFVFNQADFPNSNPTDFNDPGYKDPTQGKAYAYIPYAVDPHTGAALNEWRGPKDSLHGSAGEAQSSRLKNDSIHLIPAGGSGQTAPVRTSVSPSLATAAGIAAAGVSFGWGPNLGLLDYMDLNGDGFPDYVSQNHVQFTGPRGGYFDSGDPGYLGYVSNDTQMAAGGGIDGSLVEIKGSSEAKSNTSQAVVPASGKHTRKRSNTAGKAKSADGEETGAKIGFSFGLGSSWSNEPATGQASFGLDQETKLADVNGDGLPDRVRVNGDKVYVRFNLGYTFSPTEILWTDGRFENGQTFNGTLGPSLGFNISDMEFAGGLSLNEGYTTMKTLWVDVDGDGVLDRLRKDGSTVDVAFGTGMGILPEVVFGSMENASITNQVFDGMAPLQGDQVAIGHDTGFGVGFDFTVGIGPLCIPSPDCYIILNPGADFDRGVSTQEVELNDVDGDGRPDSISSTTDNTLTVRRNLTGKTNLLKSIRNPLGGTITLDYDRTGNTVAMPASQYVMSRVEVDSGRTGPGNSVQKTVTTYQYDGGVSSPLERTTFGFSKVTARQLDPSNAVLRQTEHAFLNDNIFDAGLEIRESLMDPSGRKIKETLSDWKLVDLATNDTAALAPTAADPANVRLLDMAVSPERVKVEQRWFDGSGALAKNTWTTYAYDDLGNVTQAVDVGEPGIATDDLTLNLVYTDCTISSSATLQARFACPAPVPAGGASPFWNPNRCPTWTSLPAKAELRDAAGQLLRSRDGSPAICDNSSVTELHEKINGTDDAVTLLNYDAWGNYNHIAYPPNAAGQSYTVDYVYDDVNHANVGLVADSHGPAQTDPSNPAAQCNDPSNPVKGCAYATFDGRTGRLARQIDVNGQVTTYTYDAAGRLASITSPKEQGTGQATVTYDYNPTAPDYAYAMAHHFDVFHPDDTIDTVTFVDGIGRTTQTKQDATLFQGAAVTAADGMAVSGATEYDALGRAVKQWYPIEEVPAQPTTYNPATSPIPTQTTYDLADRVTSVTHPDGSMATDTYQFGGASRFGTSLFLTHHVDEENKAQDTYSDVRSNVLGVELLPGTAQALLTLDDYDALGEVYRTRDGAGNATIHTYDLLGRRTSTVTPDGGLVTWKYDAASNLIEKVTPNLRALGQKIAYGYDFDRPVSVTYPDPTKNVTYTWGDPTAVENGVGRVIALHDAARDMTLGYGSNGEVTRETTQMMLHNLSSTTATKMTFVTKFSEDSFGRYAHVTYPDSELLSFGYDAGGLVSRISGRKQFIYPYVNRLEYDAFLARRYQEDANGVATETQYDPLTRRVSLIQTSAPPREIQHWTYTYDHVGDVLHIDNPIPFPPGDNTQGGPSTFDFVYDGLYRLTSATGTYQYATKSRGYTYAIAFDANGNIKSKVQTDNVFVSKKPPALQKKTSYTFDPMVYGLPAPHQLKQVGTRTWTHDPDGNVTGWADSKTGARRTMTWTADDRMASSADQGSTTTETYDESGRLAIERGPQGERAFVNQWYSVINASNFYKDVWAGADRVETKKVVGLPYPESTRYFLHKDLQGNTDMVTDSSGVPYEHLLYFPGGENWILENSNTFREPYTFAGAYYDDIRMLLGVGQRWYEPREEYLYSTDQALIDSPFGVVDDAALATPYTYAENNPLAFADRDGRAPEGVQLGFRANFGKTDRPDIPSLAAFSAVMMKRLNTDQSAAVKLGRLLGKIAADPAKAARSGIATLTDRLGSKPLVAIELKKDEHGVKLSEVKISPTLGFKDFTIKTKKKTKTAPTPAPKPPTSTAITKK